MILFRGVPVNLKHTILGKITTIDKWKGKSIFISDQFPTRRIRSTACITKASTAQSDLLLKCFKGIAQLDYHGLNNEDIVLLDPDGTVTKLWDSNVNDNTIMITNTCNCDCIMCPQPSGHDSINMYRLNSSILSLVNSKYSGSIGLTGGEPTLKTNDLFNLLKYCKRRLKSAHIYLLTNGVRYSSFEIVRQLSLVLHPNLTHCVSFNSDVKEINDKIMGTPGSFEQTIRGLHNLALFRQRIELRVVIQKANYSRLPNIAEFIYRNFPYTSHIAFMGLETTGEAITNLKDIWVDPNDYVPYILSAISFLHQRELNVSIYNLPLCILPRDLWKYCRDSISSWKKVFTAECNNCSVQNKCPGFFKTSKVIIPGIHAIN